MILPALVLLGACGGKKEVEAVATPIAAGTDVSFEDFLTDEPSASPSATPAPRSAAGSGSSGATRTTARPTATPVAKTTCPTGQVTGTLLNFDANESNDSTPAPDGTREWIVRASGTVRNATNHNVSNIRMELAVQLDGRGEDSDSTSLRQTIGPGSQATWNAEFDFDSEDEPKERDATFYIVSWSWADAELDSKCGTVRWSG